VWRGLVVAETVDPALVFSRPNVHLDAIDPARAPADTDLLEPTHQDPFR
jgi:hypothetical protein